MMRAQRVRDAENRIELQIAKWTAEGAVKSREELSILRRKAYVSCRRYVGISPSARSDPRIKVAPRDIELIARP